MASPTHFFLDYLVVSTYDSYVSVKNEKVLLYKFAKLVVYDTNNNKKYLLDRVSKY